ncbi:hypothetical protein TEQG_08787 [Trichophyton equinum CBS 127.97]|uniref:Uncharacterized protein n=1 Tax=Trichophyton equinum (strain ATCC MYA-4606 / CBS 127.97) TaxID=559882 RepID=F2Q2H5_TRIEC|nr:hypothetical protein TEQG_08787 [Trichophyton equinum CBS 127.97]
MSSTALSFASSVPPFGTELPWPEISPDGKAHSSRGSSDDNEELRGDGWVDEDLRVEAQLLPLCLLKQYHSRVEARIGLRVTAEVFTLCHCQCILFVEDILVPTLLVVPKKESADEDWLSVSREIYQLLETNDLSQFNVEICDERVTTPSIIMPSNPAPPEPLPCVRCLGNLYAVTNPNCNPCSVLAIDCFHYGESLECDKNPTSVLVTIKRSSKGPWKDTREAIQLAKDKYGPDSLDKHISDHGWNNQMLVGLSPGIYQSRQSGSTFGGWIEVQQDEGSAWKRLGLTRFHSAYPDPNTVYNVYPNGFSIHNNLIGQNLHLGQPPLKYARSVLEDIKDLIQKPPTHLQLSKRPSKKMEITVITARSLMVGSSQDLTSSFPCIQLAAMYDEMAKMEYFHTSSTRIFALLSVKGLVYKEVWPKDRDGVIIDSSARKILESKDEKPVSGYKGLWKFDKSSNDLTLMF